MPGATRTTRLTGPLALLLALSVSAADGPPAGKKVSFPADPLTPAAAAKAIREQTGAELDVSALADRPVLVDARNADFWPALERLAAAADSRVVVTGSKIALRPGRTKSPSSVTGPFRFSVREILVRGEPETGASHYTLALEAAWEPGLLPYRIDTAPKITSATDDTGNEVTVSPGGSRTFTSGLAAPLTVHPEGVTRKARSVTLSGSIRVTVADELLSFTFDPAGKPATARQKGVEVTPVQMGPDGKDWVVELATRFPKGSAVFESHEYYWARNNTAELVPPNGASISLNPTDFGEGTVRYVFKNLANRVGAGWTLRYRTPGPMREVTVPFELKDIPLP